MDRLTGAVPAMAIAGTTAIYKECRRRPTGARALWPDAFCRLLLPFPAPGCRRRSHHVGAVSAVPLMNQLNIQSSALLYEAFTPAEAKHVTDRLEMHHTPKHGW